MSGKLNNYNFRDFFSEVNSSLTELPACHTTDGFRAREIMKSSRIEPKECNVFKGEKLLYFFYGRPSFRLSDIQNATSLNSYWPVTFLFRSDIVSPKRIFPFDTGAYYHDRFNNFFREEMNLDVFEMEKTVTAIPRFIKFFYDSNENYYLGKTITGLENTIPNTFFELESYYELIKNRGINEADDRSSAVEIQTAEGITLTKDCIELIIAPQIYFDDENFRDSLVEYAQKIVGYQTSRGNPREFHMTIFHKVQEHLQSKQSL